jgi:phosphoenolpyruvate synthase/pyruvate phosphate dikinase
VTRLDVTWLDGGRAVDALDVGERAATLAKLRTASLPALRAFVLGRNVFEHTTRELHGDAGAMMHLPQEAADMVRRARRQLGGPVAVRRSALPDAPLDQALAQGEAYLHIMHPTDTIEAIRRLWTLALRAGKPVAVIVQRFVVPDVSARVREEGTDVLVVESTYGVGDLLASNLVVPDRHRVARSGNSILSRHVGRKSQMTIPRTDGGVVRVPVPVTSSRELALEDRVVEQLAGMWRDVEGAIGTISRLSASLAGEKLSITSAISRKGTNDELMLG